MCRKGEVEKSQASCYNFIMFKNFLFKKPVKLEVGMPAPEFELKDANGSLVRLSSFRGKNVVIAFFPLAWTPI